MTPSTARGAGGKGRCWNSANWRNGLAGYRRSRRTRTRHQGRPLGRDSSGLRHNRRSRSSPDLRGPIRRRKTHGGRCPHRRRSSPRLGNSRRASRRQGRPPRRTVGLERGRCPQVRSRSGLALPPIPDFHRSRRPRGEGLTEEGVEATSFGARAWSSWIAELKLLLEARERGADLRLGLCRELSESAATETIFEHRRLERV